MLEGIEACLEFSKDEASECSVLVKLFEQAVNFNSGLDTAVLTTQMMCEYLSCLVDLLRDSCEKLKNEDTVNV
jgi:hypothetical protein